MFEQAIAPIGFASLVVKSVKVESAIDWALGGRPRASEKVQRHAAHYAAESIERMTTRQHGERVISQKSKPSSPPL
jgi:hypothetical protein